MSRSWQKTVLSSRARPVISFLSRDWGRLQLRPIQHPAKVTPGETFFSRCASSLAFFGLSSRSRFRAGLLNGTPRNRRLKIPVYIAARIKRLI